MNTVGMADDLHHELSQHAAGLRGLARDLLRDPHAADDVVQATMHQALAHRQLRQGPRGGWLHRTLVNFVHQWRRGERRRLAREASLPIPEPAPAMADQLARRELLRAVTDAVLRLDEPYQTTVFLRYFEDLPPRAIARATATNTATVKSRLARGLVMLRARLDQQHGQRGDWRQAAVFAFGLYTTTLIPLPIAALVMTASTKILLAAGVLCAGGLWWLGRGEDPVPAAAAASASTGKREANAAADASLPADRAAVNDTAAPTTALQADWLVHPFAYELDVRMIDSLGLPIAGHTLKLCPVGCSRNFADVSTDADGRAVIRWHGRQPQMTVEVEDTRFQARRVVVRADATNRLLLLGRTTNRTQGPTLQLSGQTLQLVATSYSRKTSSRGPAMHLGLHPFARFTDPSAIAAPTREASGAEPAPASVSFSSEIEFTPDPPPTPSKSPAIAGTVVDADGMARGAIPVVLLGSDPQPLQRTVTDEHGDFRFENVVAGNFTVRAGGDRHGLATAPVVVTTGTTPTSLQLHPGAAVRGRALTTDGHPAFEHTVEWRSLDGSWVDSTETERDGSFVLANLPSGPGTVLLLAPGIMQQACAVAASVLPDNGELILRRPTGSGSTLQLVPLGFDGETTKPTLRVWHTETGLGTRIQPPNIGDVWSLRDLPAGFYDLDAWASGGGHRALGRHWIDGTTPVDLGRVELPLGGTVQFSIAEGALPSDAAQRVLELVSHLPAGDHALLYRHADGSPRVQRFTVKAGERTEVAAVP